MRGQELRSLGFPGVWFVPGCAGPGEVSESARRGAAPNTLTEHLLVASPALASCLCRAHCLTCTRVSFPPYCTPKADHGPASRLRNNEKGPAQPKCWPSLLFLLYGFCDVWGCSPHSTNAMRCRSCRPYQRRSRRPRSPPRGFEGRASFTVSCRPSTS